MFESLITLELPFISAWNFQGTMVFSSPQAEAEAARAQMVEAQGREFASEFCEKILQWKIGVIDSKHVFSCNKCRIFWIHPWSLTWNLIFSTPGSSEIPNLETIIFRFHVKLQGCTWPIFWLAFIASFFLWDHRTGFRQHRKSIVSLGPSQYQASKASSSARIRSDALNLLRQSWISWYVGASKSTPPLKKSTAGSHNSLEGGWFRSISCLFSWVMGSVGEPAVNLPGCSSHCWYVPML